MKAHRFAVTVIAVASVSAAIGAGAATTGSTPPWLAALNARSDALNKQYGLGDYAVRRTHGAPVPAWLQAIQARSDALNKRYGLGKYARQGATRTKTTPDWLTAINARSDALNRHYGLGKYATTRDKHAKK